MQIVVQKFGGTSVGSGERLCMVADIIKNSAKENRVIVVVSAMSPEQKSNGTTSLLLKAADLAVADQPFAEILGQISIYHKEAINSAIKSATFIKASEAYVDSELAKLESFLTAIRTIGELSSISMDTVIAVGEKLSAFILSQVLNDRGIPSDYKNLSEIVDKSYKSVDSEFFKMLQNRFAEVCRPNGAIVPVVTGYFGLVPGGMVEKIGRGYTDFTAALVTAGLGKEHVQELQVWKEVDGICTADPRRVETARVLSEISALEAAELTHFGSEVLHPFTMERVTSAQIPIRVKNTFRPELPGTKIVTSSPNNQFPITAITAKKGITVVTITSNRMFDTYGFLAQTFSVLKRHGVVVDLVSTSEISISFTVEKAAVMEKAMVDLEALGQISVASNQAILAIVGENMNKHFDIPGKLFSALGVEQIKVGMISKGESQVNISCVIDNENVEKALPAVHRAFF